MWHQQSLDDLLPMVSEVEALSWPDLPSVPESGSHEALRPLTTFDTWAELVAWLDDLD